MENFSDLICSPTPVLVDIFAEWCAPCNTMSAVLKKVKEIQGDALRIIKVDIDKNPQLARHYTVSTVPTLMIFKNGKQLWRQSGVINVRELNKIIELLNNKHIHFHVIGCIAIPENRNPPCSRVFFCPPAFRRYGLIP